MHSKTHRQNHNFQIAHFLAGACHTADGAYALLCDLREDRQTAADHYQVVELRNAAKEIKANELLESENEADRKEAKADLLEIENERAAGRILYDAALAEIAYIDECIARITPFRKYAHLPDPESHEACQQEEWKLELMDRAENYLLTVGHIPTDQFATMRLHPEFKSAIWPRINELNKQIRAAAGGGFELTERKKDWLMLTEPKAATANG